MELLQVTFYLLLLFATTVFGLNTEWWKHANIYEIYLKSFKDSDGDGMGDIKGVISKLDYLVDIGVDTIYMPPFFTSPLVDGGYDISDYKGIDPTYGTMEDFEQLMKELKSRGLHFIMDLVINHSSDEHEWFQKSIDKIDPYTDYYVWVDPKGYDLNGKPNPPNNWFSIFSFLTSGSAWTWNEKRKQFYLHFFSPQQPDLNLRNEKVKSEIKDIMKFWLNKGVSGFRVDAPMVFLEDEQLRDVPPAEPDDTVFTLFTENRAYIINHPDTFKLVNELNTFVRQYDRKTGRSNQTPLIGETYGSIRSIMKYYGTRKFPQFHLPFNFLLTTMNTYFDARELQTFLLSYLDNVPKGRAPNWALGNHDKGRSLFNFNTDYNSILLALIATLPGTAQVYYGEELSMEANHLVQAKDPYNRFRHRAPMQWDNTRNAGFTSAEKSWLTVHPNYWHINVQTQRNNENSTLNYFKDLMTVRKTEPFKYGDYKFHIISKWILAISRSYERSTYITLMNLGTETEPIDFHIEDHLENISTTYIVVASSPNSGYKKGSVIETTSNYPSLSVLRPQSALVLAPYQK